MTPKALSRELVTFFKTWVHCLFQPIPQLQNHRMCHLKFKDGHREWMCWCDLY